MWEWTLEYTLDSVRPTSKRGGRYMLGGDEFPASIRSNDNLNYYGDYVGFRIVLY